MKLFVIMASTALLLGSSSCAESGLEDASSVNMTRPRVVGQKTTLVAARASVDYDVREPTWHPGGASIEEVRHGNGNRATKHIVLVFSDESLLEFRPLKDDDRTNYQGLKNFYGGGQIVQVGDLTGYALEPGTTKSGEHRAGLLQWSEGDMEYLIRGEYPTPQLIRMAESL